MRPGVQILDWPLRRSRFLSIDIRKARNSTFVIPIGRMRHRYDMCARRAVGYA
jgi:hypothetical protein